MSSKFEVKLDNLHIRDRAIIEFMLASGVRVAELINLKISDLDRELHTARVVGKGSKERNVCYSKTCALFLEQYLNHPDYRPTSDDQYVFRRFSDNSQLSPTCCLDSHPQDWNEGRT